MKIKHLEHIGLAVSDMGEAKELFTQLLGRDVYKEEEVESENVLTAFLHIGQTKLELLSATSKESPIEKFIAKRGPGIHHLAFEVDDIFETFNAAKNLGLRLLNEQPKKGADNKLIFFIHPKSAGGVLIEFCQSVDADVD